MTTNLKFIDGALKKVKMPGFHYLTPTVCRKRRSDVILATHSSPVSRSHSPEPSEYGGLYSVHNSSVSRLSVPPEPSLCDSISVPVAEDNRSSSANKQEPASNGQAAADVLPDVPEPQQNNTEAIPCPHNVSTDVNSDDDDAAVVCCNEHDHFPIEVINEVLNIPVDTLFTHCFTDSQLYRDFVTAKKTFDVVLSPWPDGAEANGTKVRNIAYTLSLNLSMGPKVSPSTERQIMYPESQPGKFYLIDTECINGGIPYSDNFYVVNRYCISKISNTRCRLRITSQIKYRKSVWGFIKSFIEKNASAGIIESFNVLANLLRQESKIGGNQPTGSRLPSLSRKRVLRRKRASNRSVPKAVAVSDAQMPNSSAPGTPLMPCLSDAITTKIRDQWHFKLTFDLLIRIICIILLILVVFNAVLFYKLWKLEMSTSALIHSRLAYYDSSVLKEPPKTSEDWVRLLNHQRLLHESEVDHWKEVLSALIKLLDQMTHTLGELQLNLAERSIYKQEKTASKAARS